MYTLVSTTVLPKSVQSKWQNIDAAALIVSALFSTYRKIILTLQPDYQTDVIYVDMEQFRTDYATYSNRLSVFLQVIGSASVETIEKHPDSLVNYATYANAWQAGYRLTRTKAGFHYPENSPPDLLSDLKITRDIQTFDMSILAKYCLLSVNGYYHLATTDGDDTYIIDGGKSAIYSGFNAVGITSFRDIGAIDCIPIKETMLTTSPSVAEMKDGLDITIPPGKDIKAFFLVLGGYIVYPNTDVLWQVAERTFRLNLYKLPYLDRIYESSHYIDLGPLGLTVTEGWETVVYRDEVWSDAVVKKYLTLSQSFFVLVDSDNLFFDKITVRDAQMPGYYTFYNEPQYPLFLGTGRIGEYHKRTKDGRWIMTTQDGFQRNPMYYHATPPKLPAVAEQLSFNRPFYFSQGYLMEIGGYNNIGS